MNKKIAIFASGIAVGALCAGGAAYAKSKTETIEVTYDNIKVYKDNVLSEAKDANGNTIEPFIYDGTTYMPVRGSAELADMQVTWDGESKSVYLWDKIIPDETYLMDVAPPYATSVYDYYVGYTQKSGTSFQMSGKKYSNGFTLGHNAYALSNLEGKYSAIECTIGHVDGSDMYDKTVYFYIDGELVKEIVVGAEDLAKTISVPVNYGSQLKIVGEDNWAYVGFGNIIVK